MVMRIVTETIREETYTFTPNDGTEEVHILSGRLRLWLLEYAMDKVIDLYFPEDQTLEHIVEHHGLEEPRMKSMTYRQAREPVIIGLWPGGTHILIDGGHRRWFWAKRNKHVLKGWAVPYEVWSAYTFDINDPSILMREGGALLPQRMSRS